MLHYIINSQHMYFMAYSSFALAAFLTSLKIAIWRMWKNISDMVRGWSKSVRIVLVFAMSIIRWRAYLKSDGCLINRSSTEQSNIGVHVLDHVFANKEDTLSISCDKILLATRVWSFVHVCIMVDKLAMLETILWVICLRCEYFLSKAIEFLHTFAVLCQYGSCWQV